MLALSDLFYLFLQVLNALKDLGVEGIEQIALPEDPKVEGKIKGFAFVEFYTHIDANSALNRLCKPDAVLGCDFSAKVSFAQFPVNYDEELLAKVNPFSFLL
jgi:RNA recognition motif-containing protein